jgi:hypothetical protein
MTDRQARQSQRKAILNHLKEGKTITPIEALELFGCFRLAAIIFTLKKEGNTIKMEMIKGANGKRWGQYKLV